MLVFGLPQKYVELCMYKVSTSAIVRYREKNIIAVVMEVGFIFNATAQHAQLSNTPVIPKIAPLDKRTALTDQKT